MKRISTPGRLIAYLAALALLPLLSARLAAQAPAWPINLAFNYSSYAGEGGSVLQFDIQFSDRGITYYKGEPGAKTGALFTRLIFRDLRGGEPYVTAWNTGVSEPADGGEHAMVATRSIALPPGNYRASLYIEDAGGKGRHDSIEFDLKIPAFSTKKLEMSDVQIAAELADATESDGTSAFYKNGYVVMPNVTGVISAPFLVLNTYLELYNVNQIPTSEYQVLYGLAVNDREGRKKIFYSKEMSRPRGTASSVVEVNSIPLDSLPSGDYFVVVKAYNGLARSATDSITVMRAFTVKNPEMDSVLRAATAAAKGPATAPAQTVNDMIDPIYAGKKESELDEEYAKVRYIAIDPEKRMWDDLSGAEAKGRFLSRFWAVRDATPGTPENEDRDAYYKRVEEARSLYSAPMTPKGWDSDRGRVLLQYGKPDGIDRHVHDFNRKPYEVWTYSQLGYDFAFVDRTQTGFFRLVHSTAPGEIHFENWEREYTKLSKNWKDNNDE